MDKFLNFKIKSIHEDERIIEGHLAVFNNIDLDNEFFLPTAFDEQLEENNGSILVKMLWQHNAVEPIGKGTVTKDDIGLKFVAHLTEGVQKADEAFALAKDKVIDSFSVGFRDLKSQFDEARGAFALIKAFVREGSMVTFPANPLATISDVKSVKDQAQLKRRLERCLRDVGGLSKTFAESIIANGFNGLGEPDGEDGMEKLGEALKQHLPNLNT